jgi:hypothetical protein
LIDGCLIIAPYECIGCFAHAPASYLEELDALQALVARVYAVARPSFYEQGRAGGGAATDELGGFPHHAHLCAMPLDVDLHPLLREHAAVAVDRASDAAATSAERPYAYVEAAGRGAVYLPRTREAWGSLERLRLKPLIAELIGLRGQADSRGYPGEDVLERMANRFQRAMSEVT